MCLKYSIYIAACPRGGGEGGRGGPQGVPCAHRFQDSPVVGCRCVIGSVVVVGKSLPPPLPPSLSVGNITDEGEGEAGCRPCGASVMSHIKKTARRSLASVVYRLYELYISYVLRGSYMSVIYQLYACLARQGVARVAHA